MSEKLDIFCLRATKKTVHLIEFLPSILRPIPEACITQKSHFLYHRIKSLNESMHKAEELLGLVITHLEVQSPYDNQDEGHKLYPGNNPTSITDLIDLSDCMTCVEDYDEKEKVCFQNMNSCCA